MGEQSGKVTSSQRSAGSWLTRENRLGTRAFLAECPSNANLRYCAPGWTLFPPGNQLPISNVSLYDQSITECQRIRKQQGHVGILCSRPYAVTLPYLSLKGTNRSLRWR